MNNILVFLAHVEMQQCHLRTLRVTCVLTNHLKAGQEALEEVLAGVGHGEGAELRHHNAILLAVPPVGVASQEATHVRHLASAHVELVQHGHPIKPMVVASREHRYALSFIHLSILLNNNILLVRPHFLNSLGVSEFKLSRAVAEEVSTDPGGNGPLYFSSDGLRGLLH